MIAEPSWTMGIEEEYLLVERETGALVSYQPEGLIEKVKALRHGLVSPEMFSCQIEIGTPVCENLRDLRAEIGLLRIAVAEAADDYGLAPIAASTHPFTRWETQQVTDGDRYRQLADDLQGTARQLVISGLHVHVGIEEPDLRIDLMGQVSYFLPHLLALSTSSPFWQGRDTGLKSYRPAIFGAIPRTGLPERFESWAEYERHVEVLVNAGLIEDASKLWWDVRPSCRYPHPGDEDHRPAHQDGGLHHARRPLRVPAAHALEAAHGEPTLEELRQFPGRGRTSGGPSDTGSPAAWSTSARASWCPSPS